MKRLWRDLRLLVVVFFLGPLVVIEGGCPEKAASPASPPPSARGVTDPLARADLRAKEIEHQAADLPPVVENAKGIQGDVADAGGEFQDLLDAWCAANAAASAKIADLEKKVVAANSKADQRYRAFMRATQGACLLLFVVGVAGAVLLPTGKWKLAALAGAFAGGLGFVSILVSVAVEDFAYRYGMPIAAAAIVGLLLIGAWVLVAHIRASHELALGKPQSGVTRRIVARARRKLGVRP